MSLPTTRSEGVEPGDAQFDSLFREFRPRAFYLAYRLLGNPSEAEDVTQEAFLRAWRARKTYDFTRPFEHWLFAILTNVAIDCSRRKQRVPMISLDTTAACDVFPSRHHPAEGHEGWHLVSGLADRSNDPAVCLLEGQLSEALEQALAGLSADQRTAVLLAAVHGRTYEEIAAAMQCPVGTVRSRLHRAYGVLRRQVQIDAGAG